jgi:AsmA protein
MLKSTLKIIGLLTGILWVFFMILIVVIAIILFSNKNEITRSIILSFNNMQNGDFSFEDVELTPFKQFPDISINLVNLTYFETKSADRKPDEQSIAKINNFYLGLDVIDLLNGKLNIGKLLIVGGELTVVTYADSSINLLNAFGMQKEETKINKNKKSRQDSVLHDKKEEKFPHRENVRETEIKVDQLTIKNMNLKFRNFLNERESIFILDNFKTNFDYMGKNANLKLEASISIEKLELNENISIKNKDLKLDVQAHLDENKKLEIKKCELEFEKSVFRLDGIFDPLNDGDLVLNIDGSDASLSLFSQLLKDEEKKNLKRGDFYFIGTVKGKTFIEIPFIECSFGFNDFELINPVTKRTIKNLNLKGHFVSGENDDLSEAKLKIDTINADFPDGKLKLSGSIKNFLVPEVDLQLYLKADVTGLDEVFKLDIIDDLKGKIEINENIKGKYIESEKRFVSEKNSAQIFLDDFGFNIPGAIKADKVNGSILRKNDDYYFDNLSVISDDTDFLIDGEIKNLQYLFLGIEKEITAKLNIKSSIFDLPNFLAFDPSIKRDFPYRILNVDVDVLAKTTTSKVLKFKSFPEIDFDIKKLYATAENFLPPLKIKSGKFNISESILGFNLNCKDLKTDFLGGQFDFTGIYNSSKAEPFYLKLNTKFNDITPSQLIYNEGDTIPEYLGGKLSGSFFTDLQFPEDSTALKFLNLKDANLLYYLPEDTIEFKALNLKVSDVYFNSRNDENPLAFLYTSGNFKSQRLKSKLFSIDDLEFKYSVVNGAYKLESKMVRLFGENATGSSDVTIQPFADIPTISINYNITKFYAEEMLTTFLEDTFITGPLSLSMNLNAKGADWTSITNNLNGQINLSGKDLLLYGLDADQIIEKFKRSQSFNLVDLGAVLLAGPVGIAVTKGSDFASIFVFNSGERTTINELVSNWYIRNGTFIIEDAAFTTNKNRVASNGYIDFSKDSLELNIALIDKNGCSIFSQTVKGNLNEPKLERVKVVGTILSPVTNLIEDIFGIDCDVFYDGSIKHPIKK